MRPPLFCRADRRAPFRKVIGAQELKYMVEASQTAGDHSRFNAEFEKKLATFIGVKHLITVNSVVGHLVGI